MQRNLQSARRGSSLLSVSLAGCLLAAPGCETVTVSTGTDYRAEVANRSSVLDAKLKTLVSEVRKYPKRDDLHYEIASLHFQRGDYRKAAESITEAIELAPAEAKYHYQLGRVELSMKELDSAEKSFREAVRLLPDRLAAPYAALGDVLAQKRDIEGAIAAFEKCLALDGGNATYYYVLGCLHDMRGDREQTIDFFQEYLARGGSMYRKKALYFLEKLGIAVEKLPPPRKDSKAKEGPLFGSTLPASRPAGPAAPEPSFEAAGEAGEPEPVAQSAAKETGE